MYFHFLLNYDFFNFLNYSRYLLSMRGLLLSQLRTRNVSQFRKLISSFSLFSFSSVLFCGAGLDSDRLRYERNAPTSPPPTKKPIVNILKLLFHYGRLAPRISDESQFDLRGLETHFHTGANSTMEDEYPLSDGSQFDRKGGGTGANSDTSFILAL